MNQYPNEKDPHPNWLNPGQGSYTPAPPPAGYAQSQYYPPPAQGDHAAPSQYQSPQGPPPDYGYAQSHPLEKSEYDRKGETYFSPPPSTNPYASAPGADAIPGPSSSGRGPGPSSAGQDNQGGGGGNTMSLGAFFGNKGTPPMWQRQPPPPSAHVPYAAFPPMCLISNGKALSKGFPEVPPPCQLNPHPFATHDVTEEDWKRFLADVKRAGSLSGAQRIRSNVIPLVTGMSFFTGFMVTAAIEKKMKHKNRQAAGDLVDHWNHYFFGPRRMELVLCQASERLSGKLGAAPVGDPNQQRMANKLRQRGNDDTSGDDNDDDSSDEGGRQQQGFGQNQGHGFGDRRAGRRERREARRARRAERRERKARGDYQEPYQLFITSM